MPRVFYSAFDLVPSPKGASTHITYFVRGLVAAGYGVHLLTAGDGSLPAEDTYEGATVARVPPPASDANFLAHAIAFGQFALAHVESAPPYDVVHYRSLWSGFPLTRARPQHGYRTLFEVNGLPSVELKYHYPGLRDSPLLTKIREQELATLATSDAVICPSDVTRAYLTSLGVPRARITVIPNGVSARDFLPTPLPDDDGHVPVILYVGTLADWQGLELLINAMPKVLERHPARLRIVGRGRGRQRKALAKQVRKLGLEPHISIEPAVPHHAVPALIAASDICVAPLALNDRNVTQGCCPLKVIEYMASGRPLVAANLPVVRELAREDIDALFFAPDDPDDLARQLVRAASDRVLAQQMATHAAERAHTRLTWHEAQKKLLRVYERLATSS
ncbi:MAG: glycosyltransferase family 4 protein [Chloroflexi bacterium]|nr:glycosyltransferase family 4 protein [Chloroflexota bacterium]